MRSILEILHVTVADEALVRNRFFISSTVMSSPQIVEHLSCKCDTFIFLLTPSRILAKEITSA